MIEMFISPVYDVKSIEIEKIQANEYNPNSVALPEMKLLYKSILEDGYSLALIKITKSPYPPFTLPINLLRLALIKITKSPYPEGRKDNGFISLALIKITKSPYHLAAT